MHQEHTRLMTLPLCGRRTKNSPGSWLEIPFLHPPVEDQRLAIWGRCTSPSGDSDASPHLRTTVSGKPWGGRLLLPPFSGQGFPGVLQIPSLWSSPAEDYAGEVQPHQSSRWHRKVLWGACCARCHCALFLPPPNRPIALMFLHSYDPVLCPPNSYDEALTACTPERDCVWRWAFKELNEAFGVALVQSDWSPWMRG